MDEKDVVAVVLSNLSAKVGKDRFAVWFGDNVRLALGESTLVVEVPNQFHQNWLRQKFRADLEATCRETLGAQRLDRVSRCCGSRQQNVSNPRSPCRSAATSRI